MIETGPCLSDGSGVGQHAYGTLNFGKVTSGDNSGWLVVDADLEASGTPVNELDGTLCLDGGNGSIDVLGHHITTVKHAASHVLAMTRIALHHLVGWLKAGIGDLGNTQLLVVGLLSRDYRGIGSKGEMNTRVWNQVGLELCKINVESTVETKRSSDGGHDLSHQTVEVGVRWPLDVQIPTQTKLIIPRSLPLNVFSHPDCDFNLLSHADCSCVKHAESDKVYNYTRHVN